MLSERSLLSNFIRFSTATIASLMVFSLYSIVDGLFVARGVGEYAMTAVNLSAPFINTLFSIAVLFAVGTSTIIAIFLGEDRCENANSLFSQNITLLTVLGLVITALVIVFLEPFALLLGAEELTLPYVKEYLLGLAPFAFCFMVSYNMEILVKTDGHPRVALITVTTGCLANCVLDYVAIFLLDWGVFGAAFGPAILLSLFWRRFNFAGAVAGILTGAGVDILWLVLLKDFGLYEIIPGFLASLVVAVLVSLATKAPAPEVTAIFDKVASGEDYN